MNEIAQQAEAYLRTGAVPEAGRLLRIGVWLGRRRLDTPLAAGANALESPALRSAPASWASRRGAGA